MTIEERGVGEEPHRQDKDHQELKVSEQKPDAARLTSVCITHLEERLSRFEEEQRLGLAQLGRRLQRQHAAVMEILQSISSRLPPACPADAIDGNTEGEEGRSDAGVGRGYGLGDADCATGHGGADTKNNNQHHVDKVVAAARSPSELLSPLAEPAAGASNVAVGCCVARRQSVAQVLGRGHDQEVLLEHDTLLQRVDALRRLIRTAKHDHIHDERWPIEDWPMHLSARDKAVYEAWTSVWEMTTAVAITVEQANPEDRLALLTKAIMSCGARASRERGQLLLDAAYRPHANPALIEAVGAAIDTPHPSLYLSERAVAMRDRHLQRRLAQLQIDALTAALR